MLQFGITFINHAIDILKSKEHVRCIWMHMNEYDRIETYNVHANNSLNHNSIFLFFGHPTYVPTI